MTKTEDSSNPLLSSKLERLWNSILPENGKLVVIHSSLIHFAFPREGLQEILVNSIKELSEKGWTVAIPAFTFSFCREGHYNYKYSKSETGILANWLLKAKGSLRTPHPIYSFAVIGPLAGELKACKNETTFGVGSTFEYFEYLNATYVMFGCGWKSCTQFHRYEETLKVPYRYYKNFSGQVDFGSGVTQTKVQMYVRNMALDAKNDFQIPSASIQHFGKPRRTLFYKGVVESLSTSEIAKICKNQLQDDPLAWLADKQRVAFRLKTDNC